MRVAVVSCWKYRDAWDPMMHLLKKFWDWDLRAEIDLVTDKFETGSNSYDTLNEPPDRLVSLNREAPWCEVISKYTEHVDGPILLLQEDFFLNAVVNVSVIKHALKLMERESIGAVRLYPCPGATEPSDDPYFGPVARHTMYRNSIQATIWKSGYLRAIAERYNTPQEFELEGSPWASAHLPAEVWAFKRELLPLVPISYECTAIVNGKWTQSALDLCKWHGIEVDTSMRGMQPA